MRKLIKKFISIFKKEKNNKPAAPIFACSFTPSNPLTKKDCDQKIQVRTFIGIDRELRYEELQKLNDSLKSPIFYDDVVKKMFELITSFYSKHRSYFKSIGEELEWDTKSPDYWLEELRKLECENDEEVIVENFRLIKYHYVSQIKHFLAKNRSGFVCVLLDTLIPSDDPDQRSSNWGSFSKTKKHPKHNGINTRVGEVIATEKFQILTRVSNTKIAEGERPIKSIWKFELTPITHGTDSKDIGLDNIFNGASAPSWWSIVYFNHVGSYEKPVLFENNNDNGFEEIKVEFIGKESDPTNTEYFDSMEDIRDYCEENGLYIAPAIDSLPYGIDAGAKKRIDN